MSGNAEIFLCGNGVLIDIFVLVGTAFPLPEFVFCDSQNHAARTSATIFSSCS